MLTRYVVDHPFITLIVADGKYAKGKDIGESEGEDDLSVNVIFTGRVTKLD